MIDNRSILSFLKSIESDVSLYDERSFDRRADTIDDLEFYIASGVDEPGLKRRAEKLKTGLEEVDRKLFEKLRAEINSGKCRRQLFKKMLTAYANEDVHSKQNDQPGYDNLDLFINRLFPFNKIPEPAATPEPEMIFYQKTPVRVVLELVERCQFNSSDLFVDIGSGLGQVAIMVNLLAGIKTVGVEFDPAFCEYSRLCASSLGLEEVTFINADARQADYSEGTVFFMFTPFRGRMLHDVLKRLRNESQTRNIKLVTYGPCSDEIAKMEWLTSRGAHTGGFYSPAFFDGYALPV